MGSAGFELLSSSLDDESVCRNKFRSRKWRGVQPPDEEIEQDSIFDYTQIIIPNWLVRGKRGRSVDSVTSGMNSASLKASSSTQRNTEEGKRCHEAGNRTVTDVKSESPPQKMPPDDPRGKEPRGKNSCVGKEDKKPKGVIKRRARELASHSHRAKKAAGDTSGRASATNHTCSRCLKSFPSFQALGGHRSSCNNNKTKQITTDTNMPGMLSWQPRLNLSLSLFTPGSSRSDAGCNNTMDFHPNTNTNKPASAEELEDNEPNMIKFF